MNEGLKMDPYAMVYDIVYDVVLRFAVVMTPEGGSLLETETKLLRRVAEYCATVVAVGDGLPKRA
jgi:hypothetical protein